MAPTIPSKTVPITTQNDSEMGLTSPTAAALITTNQ